MAAATLARLEGGFSSTADERLDLLIDFLVLVDRYMSFELLVEPVLP